MDTLVQIEETGGWRVVTPDGETIGYIMPVHAGVTLNGLHAGALEGVASGPYPGLEEAVEAVAAHTGGLCAIADGPVLPGLSPGPETGR